MGIINALKHKKNPVSVARGRFIVIDGINIDEIENQASLLLTTLLEYGYDAEKINLSSPETPASKLLDKYQGDDYGKLNPQALSILYGLRRFDSKNTMEALLSAGKIIIVCGYTSSSAAHQGSTIVDDNERIKFFRWLDNLEYIILGLPKPDLSIIIDAASAIDENNAIRQAYIQTAALFANTKLASAHSNKELHNTIWELVRRIVLKDIRQDEQ